MKYGVEKLAKDLGIQAASVRVALRKAKVKKAKDGSYGWDSQKDYEAVKSKLSKKSAPAPKKKAKKKSAAKKTTAAEASAE